VQSFRTRGYSRDSKVITIRKLRVFRGAVSTDVRKVISASIIKAIADRFKKEKLIVEKNLAKLPKDKFYETCGQTESVRRKC
jgi:hypothetical protein